MESRKSFMTVLAILTCIAVQSHVFAGQSDNLKEQFLKYANIQSITGREFRFVDFLKTELPEAVTAKTDNMNNLIVQVGEGEPDLLVVASIDEPGYVISKITDDGYMNVQFPYGRAPNSLFHQFHEGHLLDIVTESGIVPGIVAIPSTHIFRGSKPDLTIDQFLIDVGADSKAEVLEMGIRVLDPVAAIKDFAILNGNRIAGPMLSRKFPAFALMEAIKSITVPSGKTVVFAWTTQSTRSSSGVSRLTRQYAPKNVIVIQAFQAQTDRRTGTVIKPVDILDSGVLFPESISQQTFNPFIMALIDAGLANNIKTISSATGSTREINAFRQSQSTVVPLAIPVKNPGSLVEVIDLDDVKELIDFIIIAVEMH